MVGVAHPTEDLESPSMSSLTGHLWLRLSLSASGSFVAHREREKMCAFQRSHSPKIQKIGGLIYSLPGKHWNNEKPAKDPCSMDVVKHTAKLTMMQRGFCIGLLKCHNSWACSSSMASNQGIVPPLNQEKDYWKGSPYNPERSLCG